MNAESRPNMQQKSDEMAALTSELLELEEDFGSEMDALRQKQEAALKRLQTAIDGVKAGKIAARLKKNSD